jgi:glycosyltransferase involved in cell wall biosynthesis
MPLMPPLTLLCFSASWGGLELNTVKLAGWLAQRGWPVEVLTLPGAPMVAAARQRGLSVVELPVGRLRAADVLGARRLARHLQRRGSRLIIASQNRDLALLALTKALFYPKLLIIYQQQMQLGAPKRDLIHTLRYRALGAWMAPLPWLVRQVKEFTRLDPRRVHEVPLCIELDQFLAPGLSQAAARQQQQLPAQGQFLGLIGRFDEGKGQYFVVEAFYQLRQELPGQDVHLVLVGESTKNQGSAYRESVLARIQELGLADYVHVREFTDAPEVFYRAIDVFVLASKSETFGMVTVEAMTSGLPVVGTRSGGTIDLVAEGRSGLLYPPGDQAALVAALQKLLLDPATARQLGQAAQQEAQRHYSHHRQCELTEAVIYELLG